MSERTPWPRHSDPWGHVFLWALFPTLILLLSVPSLANAQGTTSITSTTGAGSLGTQVLPASGNVYGITGGKTLGTNLFHSFGEFSVGAGNIAQFQTSNLIQNASMSNILGRVTGGNPSNILGMIDSATYYPSANLFLINPSGIVFGPNGSVNVGGSVSFTTAQYLRLFDGVNSANFYANPAKDGLANSVLAVAPVVDFGFLSPAAYGFLAPPDPNATITVQGSILSIPQASPDGLPNSISLIGGKVVIEGGAHLSAPNGRILLASSASPGEFGVATLFDVTTFKAPPNVDGTSFTSFASATLEPGSSLNVSGTNTVSIKGGQLVLSVNDATLNTSASPPAENTISLGPGSSMVTSNSGAETGAEMQLTVGTLKMAPGAFILSAATGSGRGGDVRITADKLTIKNQSGIFTVSQDGDGVGGDLILNVGKLSVTGSQIASRNTNQGIDLDGDGQPDVSHSAGGNITVQGTKGGGSAAESVVLSGGSVIGTSTGFAGNSGGLSITSKYLDLNEASTITTSTSGTGRNGDIVVNVGEASLSGRSTLTSHTGLSGVGAGAGGSITVQGLTVGEGKADSLTFTGTLSGIITETFGTGRLGDIHVHAKTLNLTDEAVILAGSQLDTSTAGQVTIEADSVAISGGSRVSSQAFAQDAGPVTITATNQLTLDHGSIETNTSSPTGGRGGDVVLKVGSASLSNGARITSSSDGTGRSGDINILASGSVTMTNRSTITARSDGSGNAGDISINSKEVPGNTFEMWHSTISTTAALADGGNIKIFDTNIVRLTDSIITSSVGNETKTDTLGGNVTIDPQFVILQNSQIRANAFAGSGGAIDITAGVFLADPASILSVSSTLGVSGTINIQSPVQNLGEQLTPLSQQFSSAAALLAQRCAARVADGKFSTFVVAGREGLPVEPGGFLASPSWTAELLGASLSGRYPHTQFPAVTGLFHEYDARPIQVAMFGNACH